MNFIEQRLNHVIAAAADGRTSLCVTLESKSDPNKWVQFTWDTINAAFPFADEPLGRIKALELPVFPSQEFNSWKPMQFATFHHGVKDLEQIAAFVSAYLEKVLGVSAAEEALKIEEQEL